MKIIRQIFKGKTEVIVIVAGLFLVISGLLFANKVLDTILWEIRQNISREGVTPGEKAHGDSRMIEMIIYQEEEIVCLSDKWLERTFMSCWEIKSAPKGIKHLIH